MDFGDGFHIDDACFEKDKFFEAKTNIKRKRILSYFGLPDSEERIVYYKGELPLYLSLPYVKGTKAKHCLFLPWGSLYLFPYLRICYHRSPSLAFINNFPLLDMKYDMPY